MAEYRDNGARLGWLVDAAAHQVFVYQPNANVQQMDEPDCVSADPEMPGFVLDLAPIWNPDF